MFSSEEPEETSTCPIPSTWDLSHPLSCISTLYVLTAHLSFSSHLGHQRDGACVHVTLTLLSNGPKAQEKGCWQFGCAREKWTVLPEGKGWKVSTLGTHSIERVRCSPWFQASGGSWTLSPRIRRAPVPRPVPAPLLCPLEEQLPDCCLLEVAVCRLHPPGIS